MVSKNGIGDDNDGDMINISDNRQEKTKKRNAHATPVPSFMWSSVYTHTSLSPPPSQPLSPANVCNVLECFAGETQMGKISKNNGNTCFYAT